MTETVAIVGAGTMGQGIAQVCLQAGRPAVVYDPFEEALTRARSALSEVLAMLEKKGRLSQPAAVLMRRVTFVTDLSAVSGAGIVIEAAPEDLELKRSLFRQLDDVVPGAILASNTSTLSISAIAGASRRPQRVVGLHFFNPPALMRLVEVIPAGATDPQVVAKATSFAEELGKHPVTAKDSPGFIVNRLARPYYGEALHLHGEGVPFADIDKVMRGAGFPLGPFELMDLIGIDVNYAASLSVYEGFFQQPRYRPHPIQRAKVQMGHLGKKSGRGFYTYPQASPAGRAAQARRDARPATALIVGEGQVAAALRAKLRHTEDPDKADIALDARIRLADKSLEPELTNLPRAALCWAHSAGLATGAYQGRAAAGFSLLPPLGDTSVVELLDPLTGDGAAVELARRCFESSGLQVVRLPDQPGGVAMRIIAMLVNEAVSGLAEQLADKSDLDHAMKLGTNYPKGPLEWGEQLGLATVLEVLSGIFDEIGDDRYRPQPLLKRACASGVVRWEEAFC